MKEEIITAALVNGLCHAWTAFKLAPLEGHPTATMTLLAVRPMGLDFGVSTPAASEPRIYRLGLRMDKLNLDIEFTRKSGDPQEDSLDQCLTGLLLEALEETVCPALRAESMDAAEEVLARLPAASAHFH